MARLKRWYNSEAALSVRVVARPDRDESFSVMRWRHPRVAPTLRECLLYPLKDGPGLGLLVLFPPVLWLLSLPIFDIIAVLQPLTKSDWALGLLIVPVMVPLVFSFSMVFGYALLFLGYVLVSSALGENDHPRWPEWHPADIAEGIFRWFWASLLGLVIAAGPFALFWWLERGNLEWFHWVVFSSLVVIGAGYAQMALAASLLHENILAANPVTVIVGIFKIGWVYLQPSVIAGLTLALTVFGVWGLLYKMPRMWMEAVALWAYWFLMLYFAMVALRMLGLTYHAHALDLFWFRRRPRWATSSHDGHIYVNS
jgi:hypothetical protein